MRKFVKACGFSFVALAAACAPAEPECEGDECNTQVEPVPAAEAAAIESSLSAFESNPHVFMNTIPTKFLDGQVDLFAPEVIATGDFIKAKDTTRSDPDPKADAWGANDYARNLVDTYTLTRLGDMYSYKSAKLPVQPWSDDYWALYAGSLGKRYADPGFPSGSDWKVLTDYVRNRQPGNLDHLSPAEKYDLLVGDANKTMTKYNLDAGKDYYYSTTPNKVETWMGICHGWAPAAYMVPRPEKVIQVTAADGTTKINFYPSDIKALASLLWANARASTKFIGGRCNVKNPAQDSIGRIKDQACRDTNAGTWHLAIVNQIGKSKRSMVLDATYDYEVWNQPIVGYDYVYFNPKTNKTTTYLSQAKVAVGSFPEDKFKAYRAPGTTHIVGVAMNVRWVVETHPSHARTDGPSNDAISGARYLYTLELDSAGNIIGGEWLQNAHPDFLWTPSKGATVRAAYEPSSGTWNGTTAIPSAWASAARMSSAYGQPLAVIVNKLAELARN